MENNTTNAAALLGTDDTYAVQLPANTSNYVLHLGLGVDSTAMVCGAILSGDLPRAIYFSDPGHEWDESHEWFARVLAPVLAELGVEVVLTSRETAPMPRRQNTETLGEKCLRLRTQPSISYGRHSCSILFKADAILAEQRHTEWMRQEWAAGRKVAKAIGYDADEDHRAKPTFPGKEGEQFVPLYLLRQWGLTRCECVALIERVLGSSPRKSACTFCPMNTMADWSNQADNHNATFQYALAIDAIGWADVQKKDDNGLLKRGPRDAKNNDPKKRAADKPRRNRSLIGWAIANGYTIDADVVTIAKARKAESVARAAGDADAVLAAITVSREAAGRVAHRAYPSRYASAAAATPVASAKGLNADLRPNWR